MYAIILKRGGKRSATPLWIPRLVPLKIDPKRRRRFALPAHSKWARPAMGDSRNPSCYNLVNEELQMSQALPLPPPGFDALSVQEQIDYVQSLWDHIAARPEQVPVPDWHREIIAQRLA